MTSISYDTRHASSSATALSAARFVDRMRLRWDRWRTERAIESMPAEMRKDFGWPTSDIRDDARPQ